ncbi:MAG: nucleotide sugar dehydrogenase [Sphingobacteriales bacterium]|jgi:UDP-N-acetyl-D-galactosamine dehydrogenase
MSVYQDLVDKKSKLVVVGLGYVGLPLALEFSRKIPVIGFDTDREKIASLRKGIDPNREVDSSAFEQADIVFTDDESLLGEAVFFIVAVPTPVDKYNVPDLRFLMEASATIGRNIRKGAVVVFESTMYPGCTEEECIPEIERTAALKAGLAFTYGYSPERINPGDKRNTIRTVKKIISASDDQTLEEIAKVYELAVDAGLYRAPSIKVAEAAKIVENTQRDINIALMNELSMIFDRMGINTFEVLEAAATKWNFLNFTPGLVGGHCIGVDPYYLAHKASSLDYDPKLISVSRLINDEIARNVARKVVTHVLKNATDSSKARVLVMGATFKENVSDIRNSKIFDTIRELQAFQISVDISDPYADPAAVLQKYNIVLSEKVNQKYDAVIIAVGHSSYLSLTEDYFCSITHSNALIADLKGLYRGMRKRAYWSL